jgi:TolB-like protein
MRFSRLAVATLAVAATFGPAATQAQSAKPVIAVLSFDNNSFGKDRADFDGLGKGIAEMLVTDLLGNANVRVVEREQIQKLVEEQGLTRSGAIDPTTAIRIGKIVGAQYMITGGFMHTPQGTLVLTARAINVETSAITSPQKVQAQGDDVLGLIAQLSQRINTDMKLPALRVGDASTPSSPAAHTAHETARPAAAQAGEPAKAEAKPDAKPASKQESKPETKPAPKRDAAPQPKMDVRTALLYAKALDEQDRGNAGKAVELYRAVLAKFPDYAPARTKLAKLDKRG